METVIIVLWRRWNYSKRAAVYTILKNDPDGNFAVFITAIDCCE